MWKEIDDQNGLIYYVLPNGRMPRNATLLLPNVGKLAEISDDEDSLKKPEMLYHGERM